MECLINFVFFCYSSICRSGPFFVRSEQFSGGFLACTTAQEINGPSLIYVAVRAEGTSARNNRSRLARDIAAFPKYFAHKISHIFLEITYF